MSSSSTLWATASKEWVIPSKPKPGRKPKKDPPVSNTGVQDKDEADAKGRRIQNRAAQRAFRERKQSQLAELQARILSYEQGEIERNVALQKIAKRLKEENDRLLQENAALRERLAKVERQQQQKETVPDGDKKRSREESPMAQSQANKRPKASMTPDLADSPTPPSAHSPESIPTPAGDSQGSHLPAYPGQYDMNAHSLNSILDYSSTIKVDSAPPFAPFDCGFCSDTTPCVCRDMINNLKADSFVDPSSLVLLEVTPQSLNSVSDISVAPNQPPISILDNLPAYQPPVPLRRRPAKSQGNSIFPIFPMSSDSEGQIASSAPTCSGDPSNCAACGDDSFGKAFCSAIGETVTSHGLCENCPSRQLDGTAREGRAGGGCCGNPTFCRGCSAPPAQTSGNGSQDYIPTNQAWQQIKEHPNVQFADLTLLAEVVASRSKCSGPQVVMSPPPDGNRASQNNSDHTRSSGLSSPPRLVPQEILLECGRRRVREVHSEAVRDALRLLDAKFN